MDNIVLVSNMLFHYRVPVYNYFNQAFAQEGYRFALLVDEVQGSFEHNIKFECLVRKPNIREYINIIKQKKPSAVILFLHLKDWIQWPLIHWLKKNNIPVIWWNHGVNLQDPENKYKNLLYNYLHRLADAIILYSPAEIKYIKEKNRDKVFIGFNTLNFHEFPAIEESKEDIRKEFNIPFEKVVLFAARINTSRRLEVLIDYFVRQSNDKAGLIIVGENGIPEAYVHEVENNPHILYLGEIPDQEKFNKLVKMSDVFSIPGKSGLAINQAFFWGVPYITMNVRQSPEIWYLKDGENGFITDRNNLEDFSAKLNLLLRDDDMRAKFSQRAKEVISSEGDIHHMFLGFLEAVQFVKK